MNSYLNLLLLFIGLGILSSCSKTEILKDPSAMLEFSVDTLRFDTVFTNRGSATRSFKIYNRYDQPVSIDRIYLENSQQSSFRLNVDGIAGKDFTAVEIPARDSIYVFAEVTIDPDLPVSLSPFVLEELIFFELNGNKQSVLLEAWGQNANYIPSRFSQGQQSLLSCNFGQIVWDDPKPYVIYGILFVDSCTVVIPKGTQIYIHGGIGRTTDNVFYNDGLLFFLQNGRLNTQGSSEEPVVFNGDRLEPEFKDVPGQWGGIRFHRLSRGHTLTHTHIKNAIVGVYADSASSLTLNSVQISNSSSAALFAIQSQISAVNSVFYNNYGGGATMIYGGSYQYTFCTFSNLGLSRDVMSAQNFICYDPPFCTDGDIYPLNLTVVNSILANSGKDVLNLGAAEPVSPGFLNYTFENSVLRVEDLLKRPTFQDFLEKCQNCISLKRDDKLFLNVEESDYSLDTLSVARGVGKRINNILVDKKGIFRKDPPDAGCFEFIE